MIKELSINPSELDFIMNNYNKMTQKELSEELGVSRDKIQTNMAFLNLKRFQYPKKDIYLGVDSNDNVCFIKENINKIPKCKIMQKLNLTKSQFDFVIKKHSIIYEAKPKKVIVVSSEFFEHDKHGEWYFVGTD